MGDDIERKPSRGLFSSLSRLALGGSESPAPVSKSRNLPNASTDTLRPEDDAELDKSEEETSWASEIELYGLRAQLRGNVFVLHAPPQVFDESNVATGFVPESEKSSFLSFVKKAMHGIDLSRITAPPFILAPQSQMETNAELMSHPDVFSRIPQRKTPYERMLGMVSWYISRYHRQTAMGAAGGSGRKPYNPILAEQFHCKWVGDFGQLTLTSEQVSHHPPIMAEYYENKETGIYNMGHFELRASFSGTVVKARVISVNTTYLVEHDEEYVCTFPTFVIRGFLVANPFFDQVGQATITCEKSGIRAVIDYKDKPWFRGEYHALEGKIFAIGQENKPRYTLGGNWKRAVVCTDNESGERSTIYSSENPVHDYVTPSLDEQEPLESLRVWKDVTAALKIQDYRTAGDAKAAIEDEQRAMRKQREADGVHHEPKFFNWSEEQERWVLRDLNQHVEAMRATLRK